METFDVVVVGAGLAGLEVALGLCQQGLSVLIVDRKPRLTRPIHTTGIFVRRTLEDFLLPENCLGPAIRHVTLHSARGQTLELASSRDEFRVGNMPRLYQHLLEAAQRLGAVFTDSTHYQGSNPLDDGSVVHLKRLGQRHSVRTRCIIGADGDRSSVARDLQLDRNSAFIVGVEAVYSGIPLHGEPRFHVFLDAALAPGYIAWIVHDGQHVHLGTGGYEKRFKVGAALERFKARCQKLLDFSAASLLEQRGGRIPVGGVLPRIANRRGLLVGDAAGAVSPLTAGGLDPAIRLSHHAARVVARSLNTHNSSWLERYRGDVWRKKFATRLLMRQALRLAGHPALLELGMRLVKLEPFTVIAEQVFFGRGSFPEPE